MTMHATATKATAQADTAQPESAGKKTAISPTPRQIPLWANATVPAIQFNLKVNNPGDKYEREADRVAEQVMRMPEAAVQRKSCTCGKAAGPDGMCEDCKRKELNIQRKATGEGAQTAAPPIVNEVYRSSGQPLEADTRAFMEARFGQDFSQVRVHSGKQAAAAAHAVGARAYTVGRDIVFGDGEYAPHTMSGRRLLAHELVHVVQQSSDKSTRVQKSDNEDLTPEVVGQDPGLLLCFILCEIGVPPGIWRTVTKMVLEAAWEEYKQRYGELLGQARFRKLQLALKGYSVINTIKFVLTFVVQGKIAFITVESASAKVLREQLKRMLIRRGATEAGLVVAEQIARKVAIAIEVAIAAGCGLYCGSLSYARAIVELADGLAAGIASTVQALETAGEIVGGLVSSFAEEVLVRPLLYAWIVLDVSNWNLRGMPSSSRMDLIAVGLYFSSQVEGKNYDKLLQSLSRPINSYGTAASDIVWEIAATLGEERAEIGEDPLPMSPGQAVRATPWQFINMLYEEAYIDFEEDPGHIVDLMLGREEE